MTRVQLAAATGADLASVTSIVCHMLKKRTLSSTGRGASATYVMAGKVVVA
jgi:hypothetical protein